MTKPLTIRGLRPVLLRSTIKKLNPVTTTGSTSDRSVRPRSYCTSMPGMLNASMAMKCIDQMPPPKIAAAAPSQTSRITPEAKGILPATSKAVKEAPIAIRMESPVRIGSCAPAR
jgi:hypothetical protein